MEPGSGGSTRLSDMVDWESFYAAFRRPGFVPGYEIQNHLGGGTFGEVYKAKKTSIGKAYAIKFLRLDEDTQRDAVERELDSVRLFASIDHPNLVTIEDMGVVEGVPYLIMGYAGEETLARHLKGDGLDPKRAMRYFVQACRGVLALHDRRLAHFDLKPSNIFLRGDVARVGDYGLAKLLVEGRQTLSFGRGTPQYMAPEMLKNRADHRADLYSLGVILFESFAMRLPYASDGSIGMVVREVDTAPDFPADFPGYLDPIVTRLLRIDPDDRFPGVQELLEELGQAARPGESVRIRFGELPSETRSLQKRDDDGGTTPPGAAESTGGTLDPPRRPAAPGAPIAPVAPVASGATTGTGSKQSDSSTSDQLKQAAAELARGAVGIAKGVWDGVVERVSSATAADDDAEPDATSKLLADQGRRGNASVKQTEEAPPESGRPAPDEFERSAAKKAKDIVETLTTRDSSSIGGDVVSVSTLDEDPDGTAETADIDLEREAARAFERSVSSADAPWRKELERSREERRREREPALLAAAPQAPTTLATTTVPVPPRAEGGWIGNVLQSIIVGGEIMGALITGPFLVALRATATGFDRVLNGVPGVMGAVLRVLMILLLMTLLGGLTAFAALAALSYNP